MKLALCITLLALSLCFCSCSSAKSALQTEAERKAQEYLDRTIAKCGDGYYVRVNWTEFVMNSLLRQQELFEIKAPVPVVKEAPLTEADKLNGIEWRGSLTILTAAHRKLEGQKWSEWRNGGPEQVTMRGLGNPSLLYLGDGSFYKKQGRWSIDEPDANPNHVKPDCSTIPSG